MTAEIRPSIRIIEDSVQPAPGALYAMVAQHLVHMSRICANVCLGQVTDSAATDRLVKAQRE